MLSKIFKSFLVFFLYVLLARTTSASVTTIYYAPVAAGAANGQGSCANAYAYNDATHGWAVSGMWGSGSTQIGAGTTVTICGGTYTFAPGTSGFPVLGSGSGGNFITIQGDPNNAVTFESPYFGNSNPFGGCGPISVCNAAFQIYNQNYIILDGGKSFTIENTADGTSLTYQMGSIHFFIQGDHLIVRNFIDGPVYVNQGNTSGATDTGGNGTVSVLASGSNLAIYNNLFASSRIGISVGTTDTTGPNTCPQPNGTIGVTANPPVPTGNWGTCIYNNTLCDHAWQIQGASPTQNIYANEWGDCTAAWLPSWTNGLTGWLSWQWPTSAYHQNGYFSFGNNVTSYVYNNYSHGDLGGGSPTGHVSCNFASGGCAMTAFNNILVQTSAAAGDQIFSIVAQNGQTFGPFNYYNNTLINGAFSIEVYTNGTTASPLVPISWENNIMYPVSGGWYINQSNGGTWMNIVTIDHNDYYGASALSGQWTINGTNYGSLSSWSMACGCDTHSVVAQPNLNSSYIPNPGSPAANLGVSLSGLGITALDNDAYGNPRTGASWDAGARNAGSGLNAPTGVASSNGGSVGAHTVTITWNPPTGTGLTYYVFRGFSAGGGTPIASGIASNCTGPSGGCTYTDSTVVAGMSLYYFVEAYNGSGYSSPSNIVNDQVPVTAPTGLTVVTTN